MTRIVIDTDLHDFNAETLVRTLRERTFYKKLPDAIEAQLPTPKPRCVAHGCEACASCSLISSSDLDDGDCKYCDTFGADGMHWDTCQARVR